MGICSKAREVICCNKMTDIPILQDINNASLDSKKLNTKNLLEEKNEIELNNNKLIKEKAQKLFGEIKEKEKNQEINIIRKITELDEENYEEKHEEDDKDKKNGKSKKKSSLKRVSRSKDEIDKIKNNKDNKDNINEFVANDNDETDNNENNNKDNIKNPIQESELKDFKRNRKNRGKSVRIKPDAQINNNIKQDVPKFVRNKRKSATLMGNAFKFKEKLQFLEKKIPVMYETLVSKNYGNPDNYYKRIKDLGSGSYGQVYMAKNIVTDNLVAIKIIEKVQENMIDDMEIQNEINILKALSHPNIVKIYEFFDSPINYYIVTEFCKKGELFSYIKNEYQEMQLSVLFYQVFSGLVYLHEKKILHRDLKLENIMVSEIEKDLITGEEYFWIKIIDFGTKY